MLENSYCRLLGFYFLVLHPILVFRSAVIFQFFSTITLKLIIEYSVYWVNRGFNSLLSKVEDWNVEDKIVIQLDPTVRFSLIDFYPIYTLVITLVACPSVGHFIWQRKKRPESRDELATARMGGGRNARRVRRSKGRARGAAWRRNAGNLLTTLSVLN